MPEEFDTNLFDSAEEAKEMNDLFDKGVNAPQGPVGTFQVEIKDAILGKSQSSGRLQIEWKLEVAAGPNKGTKLPKYDGLNNETSIRITGQGLKKLGIDISKLSLKNLPPKLDALIGKKASVKAAQKGEFYNIHFLKLLIAPGGKGAAGAADGTGGKKAKF